MAQHVPRQLALGVSLDDNARFANYYTSPLNQQLVNTLEGLPTNSADDFVYLWGSESAGRTHLLQALCHGAAASSSTMYLPLKENGQYSPEILQGLETLSLICVDDLDCVLGQEDWEQALFNVFNAIKESKACLVVATSAPPQQLQIELPDLQSRLQSGLTYQVHGLDDEGKLAALQLRADNRGMAMPRAVASYILQRGNRSLSALMKILEELDCRSLEEKRKLTVPLVKDVMGW
jgi:DnaA family protein